MRSPRRREREHSLRVASCLARPQVSSAFGFFLPDLLLAVVFFAAGLPEVLFFATGLTLTGWPPAASPGSGPGRKNARHCGESWDFFWIMQAVMASTFGTNSPHSRIASGEQACCCSGV